MSNGYLYNIIGFKKFGDLQWSRFCEISVPVDGIYHWYVYLMDSFYSPVVVYLHSMCVSNVETFVPSPHIHSQSIFYIIQHKNIIPQIHFYYFLLFFFPFFHYAFLSEFYNNTFLLTHGIIRFTALSILSWVNLGH